jgi:hypothetical protein
MHAAEEKKRERLWRQAAEDRRRKPLTLSEGLRQFGNRYGLYVLIVALAVLAFAGRDGLSAEPPAVGIEGRVG